jgi:hypothetical protein
LVLRVSSHQRQHLLTNNHNQTTFTMFASTLRQASLRAGTRTAATAAGNAAKQSATNYYQPVLVAAGLTLAATTFMQSEQVSVRNRIFI